MNYITFAFATNTIRRRKMMMCMCTGIHYAEEMTVF